jgi:hypothetical protein
MSRSIASTVLTVVTVGGEPVAADDIWRQVQWGMAAGLPTPAAFETIDRADRLSSQPLAGLKLAAAEQAQTWVDWLGIEARPQVFTAKQTGGHAFVTWDERRQDGWQWQVRGAGELPCRPVEPGGR